MKKANNQISARKFQKRNMNKFVIINIVGLIILIAGYFLENLFLGIVVFVGLSLVSNEYLQKANVWKLGAEGEEKVAMELRKLDRSYKIFKK